MCKTYLYVALELLIDCSAIDIVLDCIHERTHRICVAIADLNVEQIV